VAFTPQSQDWPGDSAVLLVHGIGNAQPGDYTDLAKTVAAAPGIGKTCAIYELYYDVFNDWFKEKTQFTAEIGHLLAFLKSKQPANPPDNLPETIADFAGDVLWPLFSLGARAAVTTAYRAQLRQIVLDGMRSRKKLPGELRFSIICHSLGCFYTYEMLHAIATDPTLNLRPFTDGVKFHGVVFMASPVQLIRSLGQHIGGLLPPGLATLAASGLGIPAEQAFGAAHSSVEQWVSVVGDLDPVGGFFVRQKQDWAYMNVTAPQAIAVIDPEILVGTGNVRADLVASLQTSLNAGAPPSIPLNNPHSWMAYVQRHQGDLAKWVA
jgi:hypothetical protein